MARERELWTRYIQEREAKWHPKRARAKKRRPTRMTAAEMEAMEAELDDLTREAEQRQAQSLGTT
jgi:hypothetical protein